MIIGLCGEQGSGKTTVGDILVEKYKFHKLSFSDALKDIVSILFQWPRNLLEGDSEYSREWRETIDEWWSKYLQIKEFTPRKALQLIGTDMMRDKLHPNIWINIIERQLTNNKNIVITDVRFNNEVNMIINHGGYIIGIKRDKASIYTEAKHKSEYDIDQIIDQIEKEDIIYNNGTIKELYDTIKLHMMRYVDEN